MVAATLVDLLLIELMSHLSHVKQMYIKSIHLTHELILCIQITRRRVDFKWDSTVKSPSWHQVLNLWSSDPDLKDVKLITYTWYLLLHFIDGKARESFSFYAIWTPTYVLSRSMSYRRNQISLVLDKSVEITIDWKWPCRHIEEDWSKTCSPYHSVMIFYHNANSHECLKDNGGELH